MSITNFDGLKEKVLKMSAKRVSVAAAHDRDVIESIIESMKVGIVKSPILIGDSKKIESIIKEFTKDLKDFEIVDSKSDEESGRIAVKYVREKEADILVKGKLETVFYLKPILDKENGIKRSGVLSNLTLFEMASYHKFISVTDNAIIPVPTLEEKKQIIENAKVLYDALEIEKPKVALLSALEVINPKVESTIDAACLTQMYQRGQIKGFIIDGPLAYDTAIDKKSAESKKLKGSEVAGDPDILIVPNLESGNILGKAYKFHADAKSGGVVLGASAPVVLNSRSDGSERRFNSLLIARAIAEII
uniref:Bifunctional enoyl-CoA hydratase/phosphate acetyltransferase n=1 Tax=candidate division WOR-3 bacterium TaxID=2052148 RepID=A0A7C3N7B7_UNCW3